MDVEDLGEEQEEEDTEDLDCDCCDVAECYAFRGDGGGEGY